MVKKVALIGAATLPLVTVLFFLSQPVESRQVEGVYSTGGIIGCACRENSHYFRFSKGKLIYHTTHGGPALLLGRYEKNADGTTSVYGRPTRPEDPEVLLMTIAKPNPAFLAASSEEDENERAILFRQDIDRGLAKMIVTQEVVQVTRPDAAMARKTFHDANLRMIREERTEVHGAMGNEP